MKKILYTAVAAMLIGQVAIAQPVSDRAVVPVAVSLNRVLRLNVNNGGNVEFVFNTIAQYKAGLGPAVFYNTDFTVASSTNWELVMGAEDTDFLGTDDPGNTMLLNNVGYTISESGAASGFILANDIFDPAGAAGPTTIANGLIQNTGLVPIILTTGTGNNAGDAIDNILQIQWQCGTVPGGAPATAMNLLSLLDQLVPLSPDRYVTNVLMDINAL